MAGERGQQPDGDWKPNPDPTLLTTQALLREISGLKELLDTRLESHHDIIQTIRDVVFGKPSPEVLEKDLQEFRTFAAEKFDSIQLQFKERDVRNNDETTNRIALYDEKFASIALQFRERDTRTEQSSKDSKVAVDAALQAAKEAVGEQNKSNALAIAKSEAGFTKQIDQIGLLITTTAKGTDDKIDDIKTRLTLIEGRGKGVGEGWATVMALVTAAVAIGTLLVLVLKK